MQHSSTSPTGTICEYLVINYVSSKPEFFLQVVGKCSVPLLTDTEREDILKRRSTAKSNSRIKTDNFPEEFVGTRRNFDYVLKAESKDILGTLIKAMDAVDLARNPVSFSVIMRLSLPILLPLKISALFYEHKVPVSCSLRDLPA